MVNIEQGFYLVHSFDLGHVLPDFEDFERRESRTTYFPIFRYRRMALRDSLVWYNQLGMAVMLQTLDQVQNRSGAREQYNTDTFDHRYAEALYELGGALGLAIKTSEFSFLLEVGPSNMEIDWEFVALPANPLNHVVFLEAVFIFQLCKSLEQRTATLPKHRRNIVTERTVLDYAENLFHLQIPDNFLISGDEIRLMGSFYEAWNLGDYVRTLRERFGQSISNYTFYWDHIDKHRQNLMSLFLAAIALLSLAQVTNTLASLIPGIASESLNVWLVSLAAVIMLWAGGRYVLWDKMLLTLERRMARGLGKRLVRAARQEKK